MQTRLSVFTLLSLLFAARGFAAPLPADFQLGMGYSHACALMNGDVTCWGSRGAIGGDFLSPKQLGKVRTLVAGGTHACMVTLDDQLHCWDGEKYEKDMPSDLGKVIAIADSGLQTCAWTTSGMRCWGYDPRGATGIPKDLGHVISFGVGNSQTCAQTDVDVRCWGSQTQSYYFPFPQNLGKVESLVVGNFVACAIKSKKLFCWGGTSPQDLRLTKIPADLGSVEQVSIGTNHICALANQIPRCWGSDDYWQLTPAPYLVSSVYVGAFSNNSCSLSESLGLKCWGEDPPDVPPDFAIPSYTPSKLAWDWKCTGTFVAHPDSGKDISVACKTDSYKIYPSYDFYKTQGDLYCDGGNHSYLVETHFIQNGTDVLDMNKKVIGTVSNDHYHTEYATEYKTRVINDVQVDQSGNKLTYSYGVYDASGPKLLWNLSCKK